MKSQDHAKIKEVLAAGDDSGLIDKPVTSGPLASKYYDLQKVKTEILDEIGEYSLADLEISKGQYEYAYDYLGNMETALRTFGLADVGIEETPDGYTLGDQTAKSIDELEFAEETLTKYAEQVAKDMNDRLDLPGALHFSFSTEGDGAFRLFYDFEDQDIPELQKLGCTIEESAEATASFDRIIAELEKEGCHDIALKLHAILRES